MEALYECITLPGLYATLIDRIEEKTWPELHIIDKPAAGPGFSNSLPTKKIEIRLPYLDKLEM